MARDTLSKSIQPLIEHAASDQIQAAEYSSRGGSGGPFRLARVRDRYPIDAEADKLLRHLDRTGSPSA